MRGSVRMRQRLVTRISERESGFSDECVKFLDVKRYVMSHHSLNMGSSRCPH